MNTPALPAYLQNRQSQGVAARATAGMGGVLPPHISIRGNSFTLIDAAGNQQPIGPIMDACVVDISDHMNKRYYENDWTPGSDEPPTCFSRNGVAPSRDSVKPQAPTCAQCEWNVRGSDVSKISGKGIKACRDEKDLALLLPAYPQMLFQLTVPPGSFKNWSSFTQPFLKGGTDISDVLVRFGFQPQVNGVMTFQAISYIDETVFGAREQALASKATDALVGRNDVPIAITHQPAPNQQALAAATQAHVTGNAHPPAAQFGGQPQAQVPFGATMAGQPAPNAVAGGQTLQQPAPNAATRSPSEPAKRHRRTRAEIAADNAAAAAAQAGGAPSQPSSAPVQPSVPFPVSQPSAPSTAFGGAPAQVPLGNQPAPNAAFGSTGTATQHQQPQGSTSFATPAAASPANGGTFGIQPGGDPNVDPQLAAMLASIGQ